MKKEMRILLTYLLTEITKNKPEFIDYAYIYWLLNFFEEEERKTRLKMKKIISDAQKENYDLTIKYTSKNLKEIGVAENMQPISLSYNKYKSKKIDKLIDKQMNKFSQDVKNQILNGLNTGDVRGVEELLEKTLKQEKKSYSTVSRLMRISRTENTYMRSQVKLDIQRELASQGIEVRRRWVHTLYNPTAIITDEYEPRLDHLQLHGQLEDRGGYFHTPLGSGKAPGMFGIPQEDINCRCDVEFVLK